jgi:hypothetical protein
MNIALNLLRFLLALCLVECSYDAALSKLHTLRYSPSTSNKLEKDIQIIPNSCITCI